MKLPRQSEKDIQQAICDRLAIEGALVLQFARIGARPACPRCGSVVGRIVTQDPGLPDVLTIWANERWLYLNKQPPHIWLEIKRPGEKPNPAQLIMHSILREAGDAVYVVESVEQTMAALKREGIKLRT